MIFVKGYGVIGITSIMIPVVLLFYPFRHGVRYIFLFKFIVYQQLTLYRL